MENNDIQDFIDSIGEDAIFRHIFGADGKEIAIIVSHQTQENQQKIQESILADMSLDVETINWISKTTPDEREELKRLTKIAWHKSEIEKLTLSQSKEK